METLGAEGALTREPLQRDTTVAENVRRHSALENEIEAPMEKLVEYQQTFATRLAETGAQKAAAERRHNDAQIEVAHLRELTAREQAKQGRLAAEADVQAKRVAERCAFVGEASRRHPHVAPPFGAPPTEHEVAAWTAAAQARLQALQQEHAAVVAASRQSVEARTKEVDAATEAVAALAEQERAKSAQLRRGEQRCGELERALAERPVSERDRADLQAAVADAAARLERRKADPQDARLEAELGEAGKAIDRDKRTLGTLRRQLNELSTMAGVAGQVQLLLRDAQDKEDAATASYTREQVRACGLVLCCVVLVSGSGRDTRTLTPTSSSTFSPSTPPPPHTPTPTPPLLSAAPAPAVRRRRAARRP